MDSPNSPQNQAEQHLKTLAVLARYAALRADRTEDKIQAGIEHQIGAGATNIPRGAIIELQLLDQIPDFALAKPASRFYLLA